MPIVEIYARPNCGPCLLAKRLLDAKGAAYAEHDVAADRTRVSEMIGRAGGRWTVPQIFIGGRHVGGYAELAELDRRGALDQMLAG